MWMFNQSVLLGVLGGGGAGDHGDKGVDLCLDLCEDRVDLGMVHGVDLGDGEEEDKDGKGGRVEADPGKDVGGNKGADGGLCGVDHGVGRVVDGVAVDGKVGQRPPC